MVLRQVGPLYLHQSVCFWFGAEHAGAKVFLSAAVMLFTSGYHRGLRFYGAECFSVGACYHCDVEMPRRKWVSESGEGHVRLSRCGEAFTGGCWLRCGCLADGDRWSLGYAWRVEPAARPLELAVFAKKGRDVDELIMLFFNIPQ